MPRSLYTKVGIASLTMMASVFLSRIIGLLREMAIAYVGGAAAGVDAYQVAFVIPEILNHVVASGFLSVTFIPIFSHYMVQGREEEGWHVFSIILSVFGGLLLVLIAVGGLFAGEFIQVIAPGIQDPVLQAKAARMTRIILPAQFFFFAGGLFMAVQFAREKFAIPALAPLLYNLGIIAGGLGLGPWLGMEGFSWGVLAGAFTGNFAVQWWGARRTGMRFSPGFHWRHPELRRYFWLTLPLMVGLTMTFSTEFFLKFFGSYLPRGSIAGLNYGLRITLILVGLFGQAMGVASFPFMARLAAEKRLGEMNRLLNITLKYLSLVVPFSVLFMVLRQEVVMVLFQRGRFDAAATALTSRVLVYLLFGAFAFACQTVVVRGYYAMQDTVFPTVFGTVAVLLSIPLYIAGLKMMGVTGVALAISLSAILQATLLYGLWNRRTGNRGAKAVYGGFLRMALLSVAMGLLLEWLRRRFLYVVFGGSLPGNLLILTTVGLVFVVLMGLAGYVLRIPEIYAGLERLRLKARALTLR